MQSLCVGSDLAQGMQHVGLGVCNLLTVAIVRRMPDQGARCTEMLLCLAGADTEVLALCCDHWCGLVALFGEALVVMTGIWIKPHALL